MKLKHLALGTLLSVAAFAGHTALADTLTLVGVGGQNAGGEYVYPYNFSINGSSTLTSLMCIDLNREVVVGESWQVTAQTIDNSAADIAFREDAWLYNQFGMVNPNTGVQYTNAEVQFAAWDVLDPNDISNNANYAAAFDSTSAYLVNQATAAANNSALYASGYFTNFVLYVPTSNTAGWTNGTPQRFMVDPVAATPEPSSLLLMATGLLGAGFLWMRRRGSYNMAQF